MATTLAIIGKSGSGKTTIVKGFVDVIKKLHPTKSVLLIDNDLSQELAGRYGLKISNTVYGIRSGKHEYNTGIPSKMTKQEYIEWAFEDIITEVDENVDIIVSWLVCTKDCLCPITYQMNEALTKLIDRYDFAIFDCEYDLKYLNQLTDYPIDTTLLIANGDKAAIQLAQNIFEHSKKYAASGQFSVVLNKIKNETQNETIEAINSIELDIAGVIEDFGNDFDEAKIASSVENFYPRLNLPQNMEA